MEHKLLSLLDTSTEGFLVDDWEYICEGEESCSLVSLTEEQKATCLELIAKISHRDTKDFTTKTTLFDELEMDSLDVTEYFLLLKEEFKGDDEDFETDANEMRISSATVQLGQLSSIFLTRLP